MFQSIESLYFAGNNADPRFDTNIRYLGEWSKDHLYENLTEFGNLILLSDGEAHPSRLSGGVCGGSGSGCESVGSC